ncbi:unnamed protein product [Cochlearia groenlandica]
MAPTIRTIGCWSTHQNYGVDFFGYDFYVTQTETPSIIKRWIRDVIYSHRRSLSPHPIVVGVGVQWTPAFHFKTSPERYNRPADTLQLCVGKQCIIIQLTHCNRVPLLLRRFLMNPQNTFVGFWNHQDKRRLELSKHQLEMGELLDVSKYVKDPQGKCMSGRQFGEMVFHGLGHRGVSVDLEISSGDWSVDYLSLEQILQASVDAFVCHQLGVVKRLWGV